MKSLCANDEQRVHLLKLVNLVRSRQLSGSEAWSAFSSPSANKSFNRANDQVVTFAFTLAERKTYDSLRAAVKDYLFAQCSGCCSYCRRPVGHYGWTWHIEHVIPKSKYRSHAFKLSNLTLGCSHCNFWKGARVDQHVVLQQGLVIINPVETGFKYSEHLRYVQLTTESLSFAKYSTHSLKGKRTYDDLSFSELERAHAINGLSGTMAALHERISGAMEAGLSQPHGLQLVNLLAQLKAAIYRRE